MLNDAILFGIGLAIFCVIAIIGEYIWGDKNE